MNERNPRRSIRPLRNLSTRSSPPGCPVGFRVATVADQLVDAVERDAVLDPHPRGPAPGPGRAHCSVRPTAATALTSGGLTQSMGTSTSSFGVGKRESHDSTDFYARFAAPEICDADDLGSPGELDVIHVGDARDMSAVPDASVALVVTSPPYFAGKEYETALGEGHVPGDYIDYLTMLARGAAPSRSALEPGGRIAVNVANLGRRPTAASQPMSRRSSRTIFDSCCAVRSSGRSSAVRVDRARARTSRRRIRCCATRPSG